ncbi:MAG: hypothetical protein HOQ38_08775 [Nonomuraea sp.]|nr:hypothetical protein [Nonomuraea sp.]
MKSSTMRKVVLAAAIAVAGMGGVATAAPSGGDGGKAFTACLRSHGLPGFPEVAVSEDGLINLTVDGERVDVLSEKYGKAVAACQSLLPKGAVLPGKPAAPAAPILPAS